MPRSPASATSSGLPAPPPAGHTASGPGGGALLVNADTAGGGSVRVAIVGPRGKTLPGYSCQENRLTKVDDLRCRVSWPTKAALPAVGRCCIRIELTHGAALHAYEIVV
jgi:hypothetical protein